MNSLTEQVIDTLKGILSEKKDTLFKLRLIQKTSYKSEDIDCLVLYAYNDMIDIQKRIVFFSGHDASMEDFLHVKNIEITSEAIKPMIKSLLESSIKK